LKQDDIQQFVLGPLHLGGSAKRLGLPRLNPHASKFVEGDRFGSTSKQYRVSVKNEVSAGKMLSLQIGMDRAHGTIGNPLDVLPSDKFPT
jgi:hypothetical protein